MIPLLMALALSVAHADEPQQDPLCASADFFQRDYDAVSSVHRSSPQLRPAYEAESKWFKGLAGEMSGFCEAEKKFAAEMIAKVPSDLGGQCRPAEQAALTDQAVLDHSAENLKTLGAKRDEYFKTGSKGATEPLLSVAERDTKLVRDYAYTLGEVPFTALCELKWTYPDFLWKTLGVVDIAGCPPLKAFDKPGTQDKKSPSLFGRMATRLNFSADYNSKRLAVAAAAAKASRERYLACVRQFPDITPNKLLTTQTYGRGSGAAAGTKAPSGSDITGVEQDQKKRAP